jgi:hypothetical protein
LQRLKKLWIKRWSSVSDGVLLLIFQSYAGFDVLERQREWIIYLSLTLYLPVDIKFTYNIGCESYIHWKVQGEAQIDDPEIDMTVPTN